MVYFPNEVFKNILSYNDGSLKRHKEKQLYINDFFDLLQENKALDIEKFNSKYEADIDEHDLQDELFDFIITEMVDFDKCRDISLWMLYN
jgi:hypothetical protein